MQLTPKWLVCICMLVMIGMRAAFADVGSIYVNANAGAETTDDYHFAYNLNAGYMFNSYFGLEAGYTGATASYWDIATKVVLPIPLVDIYGRLGLAYANNYGSSDGALLYGVGIGIPIFPMVEFNIEDYAISNAYTQNFLMGGLQVKF